MNAYWALLVIRMEPRGRGRNDVVIIGITGFCKLLAFGGDMGAK